MYVYRIVRLKSVFKSSADPAFNLGGSHSENSIGKAYKPNL